MRTRWRLSWSRLVLGATLALSFTVLLVLGTFRPVINGGPAAGPTPQGSPGPPAWMHRLRPGDKPPQFVLFSFDGLGSHRHWEQLLPIARKVNAHFTGFLSGLYLLPDAQRDQYTGPGHDPGRASIGFGGSGQDVRTRIADLNTAIEHGNEIGTHYNGHFCGGAEPSVGRWSTEQWQAELEQFFRYVGIAAGQGLRIDPGMIKGSRTPCLEGQFDKLWPALAARDMAYDASQTSDGIAWPRLKDGLREFRIPRIRVPALNNKQVIMMDYNLWYALNRAKEDPARSAEFASVTLHTYRAAYRAALTGNRAPLVVGNHFNDWAAGAFSTATEQFMSEVCVLPETVCATHSEVIEWMRLQNPAVLGAYRAMPNAQVS